LRVIRRSLALLLCLPFLAPALLAVEEEEAPRLLRSGSATVELPGATLRVPTFDGVAGPMFVLQPFVDHLGGELEVGPLQQRHALALGGDIAVFGPDGAAMTINDEIGMLSQAPHQLPEPPRERRPDDEEDEADPASSEDDEENPSEPPPRRDLWVPIDLLERTWGDLAGYEFDWDEASRTLTVSRRPSMDIPVSLEAIHLQGVTTLVLTFDSEPSYRIQRSPGRVVVEIAKDRLVAGGQRELPPESLVRGVRVEPERIAVELAPDTAASDYTLQAPFRLVFDVHGDTSAAPKTRPGAPARQASRPRGVRTIVIDPGHGGEETGATGAGGTHEKDLTLAIGRLLQSRLQVQLPVRVVLTRTGDETLHLDSRAAIANQYKADLFISLHLNSYHGRLAHGAETYFLSLQASDERAAEVAALENLVGEEELPESDDGDPLYDLQLILWDLAQSHHLAESQRFAKLVQEELNLTLGLTNRGVKQAPFRVLKGAAMPAVLVELGFISNPREEERLQSLDYQSELVDALVRAIVRYRSQLDSGAARGASQP
jgi:N-acetylmuramoyl-L-alanine amidase